VALKWQAQTRDKDQIILTNPADLAPLPDISGSTAVVTIAPLSTNKLDDIWLSLTFGCS
jgi:hypothetical protein